MDLKAFLSFSHANDGNRDGIYISCNEEGTGGGVVGGGRHRGGVVLEDGVMKEMKGLFNLVSR